MHYLVTVKADSTLIAFNQRLADIKAKIIETVTEDKNEKTYLVEGNNLDKLLKPKRLLDIVAMGEVNKMNYFPDEE